jgi:hypothetical protein
MAMKHRCLYPACNHYQSYGGRGISVCDRWLNLFENFLADMGRKPSPTHSLDRINNDGNYEPENCHWATRAEQARNKQNTFRVTCRGVTKSVADWCEERRISVTLVKWRLGHGWTTEEALDTPAGTGARRIDSLRSARN